MQNLKEHLATLAEELMAAVAEDSREIAARATRLEKNKALLAHIKNSLVAYKQKEGMQDGERVTAVVDSLPPGPFLAQDVVKEVNRRFPDSEMDLKRVGIHLYRMLATKRKNPPNFRQVSKGGGSRPAQYEKLVSTRVRTRSGANEELLPTNGAEDH